MEDTEKQIFDETQKKQAKLAKKILLGTFCGTGAVFVAVALVFTFFGVTMEIPIIFGSFGVACILLGVILYFVIPKTYNYEKYKSHLDKYGTTNVFEMKVKISELEKRIEILEKKDKE